MFRYIFLLLTTPLLAAPKNLSADLSALCQGTEIPGMAAVVVSKGDVVAVGFTGIRKIGSRDKIEINDKFHIGSCTKSMTATLAAIMVKEGKITWETTISEVFPKLKIHADFQKVTLRQLLSNTGGVTGDVPPAIWGELWEMKKRDLTKHRQFLVKGILSQKPAYPPGSSYEYSNAGFSIAGHMLETIAKTPYEKLLTQKLFRPLEMKTAGFRSPSKGRRADQPYGHSRVDGKLVAIDPEPRGDNPRGIAPAGAVHASILDLARYAQLHMGKNPRILSQQDRSLLYQIVNEKRRYALGWGIRRQEGFQGPILSHTGSNTMNYALIWIAPEDDFAIIIACNSGEDEASEVISKARKKFLKDFAP